MALAKPRPRFLSYQNSKRDPSCSSFLWWEGRYSMLCKHKKMEKLAKAKKLGLVLSHYQPLTWVWRVMAWIYTPFVFSMIILNQSTIQPNPPNLASPYLLYHPMVTLSMGAQLWNTQPNPAFAQYYSKFSNTSPIPLFTGQSGIQDFLTIPPKPDFSSTW